MRKREKNKKFIFFSVKKTAITLTELLKGLFLRKSKREKEKGAVSPAPLSFVLSFAKGAKVNK